MELIEAINMRRSIRKFLPDPVDENHLQEIVRAGTLAANAENKQMWYFVAVTNKSLIEQMSNAVSTRIDSIVNAGRAIGKGEALDKHRYFLTFFRDAPAVIAVFSSSYVGVIEKALEDVNMEFKTPLPVLPAQLSIGAAIQNISLAACAMGYGTTCMYGPVLAFREIGKLLEVPEQWVLTALLPIGIPATYPKARPRKSLAEVYKLIK